MTEIKREFRVPNRIFSPVNTAGTQNINIIWSQKTNTSTTTSAAPKTASLSSSLYVRRMKISRIFQILNKQNNILYYRRHLNRVTFTGTPLNTNLFALADFSVSDMFNNNNPYTNACST